MENFRQEGKQGGRSGAGKDGKKGGGRGGRFNSGGGRGGRGGNRGHKKPQGRELNGWLNFYKPVGMTSTDAVATVKRLCKAQKVGHGGTLDPLADGVLPLAFGRATKTMQFSLEADKAYKFTVTFGESTTTDDAEGEAVHTSDKRPTRAEILAVMPQFLGEIEQMPPMFSALKVNGKRAYDLARAGEKVELQPRKVTVKAYELVEMADDGEWATFEATVTKGTYVRSLARDMGEALGCYGHITSLTRTRAGAFCFDDMITLETLEDEMALLQVSMTETDDNIGNRAETLDGTEKVGNSAPTLLPVGAVLDDIPAYVATVAEERLLRTGQKFVRVHMQAGLHKVMNKRGDVLSVVDITDGGALEIVRNFVG